MKRFLIAGAIISTSFIAGLPAYAFWGNKPSEAQWNGYRQCMSDKRKAHTEIQKARLEQSEFSSPAIFWDDSEKSTCANEYGIERKFIN